MTHPFLRHILDAVTPRLLLLRVRLHVAVMFLNPYCKKGWLYNEVPPRFELGSLDSKSRVLTITPWDRRRSGSFSAEIESGHRHATKGDFPPASFRPRRTPDLARVQSRSHPHPKRQQRRQKRQGLRIRKKNLVRHAKYSLGVQLRRRGRILQTCRSRRLMSLVVEITAPLFNDEQESSFG